MNGSANPQWEPFVSSLPREAQVSRFPLAPALNVLLAASVVLVAVTLLSQNAPRDLRLYRDSFGLYRDNSIVLTAAKAKVSPRAASEPVSQGVPQALQRTVPQASSLNRTRNRLSAAPPIITLSESPRARVPAAMVDTLGARNDAGVTEWPARSLELQASENRSALLDAPSGVVDRPVMTIAGPMQWPSNGAAPCRWPACQLPTVTLPLQNNTSFMPLPPQLSDPWVFSFASRLANTYPEVWELLVLPTLGAWGQTLEMGSTRFSVGQNEWRLSTQTSNGLQFSTGYPLATPLQWFGVEANGGVAMRTPGGLEVVGSTRGIQVFQYFTTSFGQVFGGITPNGPIAGAVYRAGNLTAIVGTLLSEGQPRVAGGIGLRLGDFSLDYLDTTSDRAVGIRFSRAPLDISFARSSNSAESQLRLAYTPTSGGPTILGFWSSKTGLNVLIVGSLDFGSRPPTRVQEYAAPLSTPGAASNH